jgi:hypothetical protein
VLPFWAAAPRFFVVRINSIFFPAIAVCDFLCAFFFLHVVRLIELKTERTNITAAIPPIIFFARTGICTSAAQSN